MFRTFILIITLLLSSVVFAQKATPALNKETKINKTPAPYTHSYSGAEMYKAYCGACHGDKAKGDGPAASALKGPIPDLTTMAKRNNGNFPSLHVYNIVRGNDLLAAHGSPDMPVWGPVFRVISQRQEAEVHLRIDNLVKYIDSLQQK